MPSSSVGTRTASQGSKPHQNNSFSPMLVHKCDNCKKEIKGRDKEIIAGFTWPQFSFCGRCGKPIIAFLKKRKLLPSKTTG